MTNNNSLRIAIDISQIVYGTGVSMYTKLLVTNLLKIDKDNKYLLFGGTLRQKEKLLDFSRKTKVLPISPSIADVVWNRLHTLPIEMFVGDIDVFHSSDWTQPPSKAFKVTTVHDLAPLLFPKETDPKVVSVHRRRLGIVKKEVDKIIVPSLATKHDLIEFGIKDEKITVIPEAPTMEKSTPSEEAINLTHAKLGITGNFILAVGANKRKNIKNVYKAYQKVKSDLDINQLVVVGKNSTELDQKMDIIMTGHISDDDLKNLFFSATMLVYASLYEGFGMPILNAFVAGCPVVTSNISSMPEVAGEAAVLVDPNSIINIAQGIKDAYRHRQSLALKGFNRVKQFSWKQNAIDTLDVYRAATGLTYQEVEA